MQLLLTPDVERLLQEPDPDDVALFVSTRTADLERAVATTYRAKAPPPDRGVDVGGGRGGGVGVGGGGGVKHHREAVVDEVVSPVVKKLPDIATKSPAAPTKPAPVKPAPVKPAPPLPPPAVEPISAEPIPVEMGSLEWVASAEQLLNKFISKHPYVDATKATCVGEFFGTMLLPVVRPLKSSISAAQGELGSRGMPDSQSDPDHETETQYIEKPGLSALAYSLSIGAILDADDFYERLTAVFQREVDRYAAITVRTSPTESHPFTAIRVESESRHSKFLKLHCTYIYTDMHNNRVTDTDRDTNFHIA